MKKTGTSESDSDEVNYAQLVTLEEQAIHAYKDHDYERAARLWSDVLAIDPNWGHGAGYVSLADCLELLGLIREAKTAYLKALEIEKHPMYVGAYASYLYLHGSAEEALSVYLKYLQIEAAEGADDCVFERIVPALERLGARLGRSEATIKDATAKAIQAGRRGERPILSDLI